MKEQSKVKKGKEKRSQKQNEEQETLVREEEKGRHKVNVPFCKNSLTS